MSEPDVQDIEISRRKCRFADENNLDVATKYSIEACNLQCQKEAHLLLYNCTHHYMPNTGTLFIILIVFKYSQNCRMVKHNFTL